MGTKIWFRNNSDKTWENYNVGGGVYITITPGMVFFVGPKSAEVLRKNLCYSEDGKVHPWLEELSEKDISAEDRKNIVDNVEVVDDNEVKKISAAEKKRSNGKQK